MRSRPSPAHDKAMVEARRSFPDADHELSEAEIEERFGSYLADALWHFRHDYSYLVRMMEQARIADMRRESAKRWAEGRKAS